VDIKVLKIGCFRFVKILHEVGRTTCAAVLSLRPAVPEYQRLTLRQP